MYIYWENIFKIPLSPFFYFSLITQTLSFKKLTPSCVSQKQTPIFKNELAQIFFIIPINVRPGISQSRQTVILS